MHVFTLPEIAYSLNNSLNGSKEVELKTNWLCIQKHAQLLKKHGNNVDPHFTLLQNLPLFIAFLAVPWFAPVAINTNSSLEPNICIIDDCYTINKKKTKRTQPAKTAIDKENSTNHSVELEEVCSSKSFTSAVDNVITAFPVIRII